MFSKILVFIFSLIFSLHINAQNEAKIGNVSIGTEYSIALSLIKNEFGIPTIVKDNCVEYHNVKYHSLRFNKILFKFKNSILNEVRFFINAKNKYEAVKNMKCVAKEWSKKYELSEDYDDGAYFYMGGVSPKGIGFLFTISIAQRQGRWDTELTYGPF